MTTEAEESPLLEAVAKEWPLTHTFKATDKGCSLSLYFLNM
jgi:hypothetical protein